MLGDYKIEIIKLGKEEPLKKIEKFNNIDDYAIRVAELIIRLSQTKEESKYKMLCYENKLLTKEISIKTKKEKKNGRISNYSRI